MIVWYKGEVNVHVCSTIVKYIDIRTGGLLFTCITTAYD